MASDLKSDLVMTSSQRRPNVHLMGNPAVCHKQQGFQPQTSMDQGGINVYSTSIELTAIGQLVVALTNCKMSAHTWI